MGTSLSLFVEVHFGQGVQSAFCGRLYGGADVVEGRGIEGAIKSSLIELRRIRGGCFGKSWQLFRIRWVIVGYGCCWSGRET